MPDTDKAPDSEVDTTSREKQEKDKNSKSKSSSKAKDLSHVPCKFFKVGSCTAGPSCPFSHQGTEPGGQKGVCAWYIKGNCKFGHKCALAHVLPGQSMSMDKRNKKAAQLASGGGQTNGKDREGKADKSRVQKSPSNGSPAPRGSTTQARSSSLLSGSTAPTRVLPPGSRPPLPISKAVPAPAVQDTDFTFDFAKAAAQAPTDSAAAPVTDGDPPAQDAVPTEGTDIPNEHVSPTSSSLLPLSTPSQPRRFTGQHGSSPSVDFGPVGSPPRSSPSNPTRVNGFSPGVSPRDTSQHGPPLMSTSPFSAPGGQSLFMPYEQSNLVDSFKTKSGLAASLGTTRSLHIESIPPISQRSVSGPNAFEPTSEVLEDEDMEEFIPSSLTELLSEGGKSRRMSRTSVTQTGLVHPIARPSVQDHHHRYSRSVPAPSLLNDISSIWSSNNSRADSQVQHTPGFGTSPGNAQGMGLGAPSSFKSNSGFLSSLSDNGLSPSLLSPSNASAAFLPGLHQHYMSRPSIGAVRNVPHVQYAQDAVPSHLSVDSNGVPMSSSYRPPQGHHPTNHNPADILSNSHSKRPQHPSGRPIPPSNTSFLGADSLSPSARALQAHAPGQSLPQGLAAGYSRIHVQPPPPNVPSPAMSGAAFSPGSTGVIQTEGQLAGSPDWLNASPLKSPDPAGEQGGDTDVGALSSMFSRLSYSAAAARGSSPAAAVLGTPSPGNSSTVPMSMNRRPSGRGWSSHPLSSPLSGPVLTNDDDDLFSMDEEK